MHIVTESVGKYISLSHYRFNSGFSIRLMKNRGDNPSTTAAYSYTPTIFKVNESMSHQSYDVAVPGIFHADDLSRDYIGAATSGRIKLGSVVYNDGVAHHEYNGVYHAKCDGTITFPAQLDKNDPLPSPGNPLNVNPFTGLPDSRVIFVSPGYNLYETATNSGWNPANNRYYHEMHLAHMVGFLPVNETLNVLYQCSIEANMVSDTLLPGADSDSTCWVSLTTLLLWKSPLPDFPDRWLSNSYSFQPSDLSGDYKTWLVNQGIVSSADLNTGRRVRAFDAFLRLADQGFVQQFLTNRYKTSHPEGNGYTDYRYTAITTKVDPEELTRRFGILTSQVEQELLNAKFDQHVNWNDLAYRAYQDIGMWNGNGIQYLTDIAHLTTDTRRLVKTLKSLAGALRGKKLKAACKAASATYLSIHYGIKLSVLDSKELARVISSPNTDFGRKKCQAVQTFVAVDQNNGNSWNVNARYQLMYNTKKSMDKIFMEYLKMLDVVPDLSNLWDALPYSFCIDWFIRIGDLLESIDNYTNICSSYDVEAAGQSTKYTRTLSPSELGIAGKGDIHFSLYTRGYSRMPVTPIPSKLTTSTNPFTHSVEAGALLASK